MRFLKRGWILAVFLAVSLVAANYGAAASWDTGDVFVGVSNGTYYVYDNSGVFKEPVRDWGGGYTTGCAFNPDLTKLYATHFSNNKINVHK